MLDREKLDRLREILGDDAEGIGDLIDTFLEETPRALDQMRTGLADEEPKQVASAAHKIKGSAATIGAMTLSDLCKELEAKAREGDLAAVAERLEELEDTWEATEAAMQDAHPVR